MGKPGLVTLAIDITNFREYIICNLCSEEILSKSAAAGRIHGVPFGSPDNEIFPHVSAALLAISEHRCKPQIKRANPRRIREDSDK
jgi:hypothetical protein